MFEWIKIACFSVCFNSEFRSIVSTVYLVSTLLFYFVFFTFLFLSIALPVYLGLCALHVSDSGLAFCFGFTNILISNSTPFSTITKDSAPVHTKWNSQ